MRSWHMWLVLSTEVHRGPDRCSWFVLCCFTWGQASCRSQLCEELVPSHQLPSLSAFSSSSTNTRCKQKLCQSVAVMAVKGQEKLWLQHLFSRKTWLSPHSTPQARQKWTSSSSTGFPRSGLWEQLFLLLTNMKFAKNFCYIRHLHFSCKICHVFYLVQL